MAEQHNQGSVKSVPELFWWGVFALLGVIAFVGIFTAPLASLVIYIVMQAAMIGVAVNSMGEDIDGDVVWGMIIISVIAAVILFAVSFVGNFLAFLLGVAFLAAPSVLVKQQSL